MNTVDMLKVNGSSFLSTRTVRTISQLKERQMFEVSEDIARNPDPKPDINLGERQHDI
jgi:hypothetical protein